MTKLKSAITLKNLSIKHLLLFALPFAAVATYLIARSFAVNPSVGGYVYDQTGRPVAGVVLVDCNGHFARTDATGNYFFEFAQYQQPYCVRIASTPKNFTFPATAYNNWPNNANAESYEWQVAHADCFLNTQYCGNGKIGGDNNVWAWDLPQAKEFQMNFKIVYNPQQPPPIAPQVCIPANGPQVANGGSTYVNWHFNQNFSSIKQYIRIMNDVSTSEGYFTQSYNANIDDTGSYFGLQSTKLALFSEFGTTDTRNARAAPNSAVVSGSENGSPYISVRRLSTFQIGAYGLQIRRAEFDGTGDWYNFYVASPGDTGLGTYIGGLRFTRHSPGVPAQISDGGSSWVEYFSPPKDIYSIAPLSAQFSVPIANDILKAQYADTKYGQIRNADISYNKDTQKFTLATGGRTQRCNAESLFSKEDLNPWVDVAVDYGGSVAQNLTLRSDGYIRSDIASHAASTFLTKGFGSARALKLNSANTGGVVMDGDGNMYAYKLGNNNPPPLPTNAPTWPGTDWARDFMYTQLNPVQGYILDQFGLVHAFGGAAPVNNAQFLGFEDNARRMVLVRVANGGIGGYVLDGHGALHPFSAGNSPLPPTPNGVYTSKYDIFRSIIWANNGTGGYTMDRFGIIHQFAIGYFAFPEAPNVIINQPLDSAQSVYFTQWGNPPSAVILDKLGNVYASSP